MLTKFWPGDTREHIGCDVCGMRLVATEWYRHGCFLARRAQIWRSLAPVTLGTRPHARSYDVNGLRLLRTWESPESSFKDFAVYDIAERASRNGYKRYATATCGSGGRALVRWCRRREFECDVFVPAAIGVGDPLSWAPELDGTTTIHRVSGGWAETYRALWSHCEQHRSYPIYPSGDPAYLTALRSEAETLLSSAADRPLLVPCASGMHLMALLLEKRASEARAPLVGVQLEGFSPLVSAKIDPRPLATDCPVPSMHSEQPVNGPAIRRLLDETPGAMVVEVSRAQYDSARRLHGGPVHDTVGPVDGSAFACIAAAEMLEGEMVVAVTGSACAT